MFWYVCNYWERGTGDCWEEGAVEVGLGEEFDFPLLAVCKVCGVDGGI